MRYIGGPRLEDADNATRAEMIRANLAKLRDESRDHLYMETLDEDERTGH